MGPGSQVAVRLSGRAAADCVSAVLAVNCASAAAAGPPPLSPHTEGLRALPQNAILEGPTWQDFWTQNSYGPTFCALPYLQEPLATFLQNSQSAVGCGVERL